MYIICMEKNRGFFVNKNVIVTGGAQGIGKAIVQAFTNLGAQAIIIDKNEPDFSCAYYFRGNLAEQDTLSEFAQAVIAKYDKIDFLINNAGLSKAGLLSGCSYEDFLYVQKIGATAPYFLTCLFKDYFNKGAAIVNISSSRQFMSQEYTESYSASKGGIGSLTHAMAVSLAGRVRVNAISPGWIDTTGSTFGCADKEQHPVKRVGVPEDIAKAVIFLCSDDSSFITGQNIVIDGGMSKLMIYHDDFGWSYKP